MGTCEKISKLFEIQYLYSCRLPDEAAKTDVRKTKQKKAKGFDC